MWTRCTASTNRCLCSFQCKRRESSKEAKEWIIIAPQWPWSERKIGKNSEVVVFLNNFIVRVSLLAIILKWAIVCAMKKGQQWGLAVNYSANWAVDLRTWLLAAPTRRLLLHSASSFVDLGGTGGKSCTCRTLLKLTSTAVMSLVKMFVNDASKN